MISKPLHYRRDHHSTTPKAPLLQIFDFTWCVFCDFDPPSFGIIDSIENMIFVTILVMSEIMNTTNIVVIEPTTMDCLSAI